MTNARKAELQDLLFVQETLPAFPLPIEKVSREDGCKVCFTDGSWVICRFSGTEPLLRMAAEGSTQAQAREYLRLWQRDLGL